MREAEEGGSQEKDLNSAFLLSDAMETEAVTVPVNSHVTSQQKELPSGKDHVHQSGRPETSLTQQVTKQGPEGSDGPRAHRQLGRADLSPVKPRATRRPPGAQGAGAGATNREMPGSSLLGGGGAGFGS